MGITPARGYLKIPNLTPKSPLHVVERGLETRPFSPLYAVERGRGVRLKGK
jgi:hypothetical protein